MIGTAPSSHFWVSHSAEPAMSETQKHERHRPHDRDLGDRRLPTADCRPPTADRCGGFQVRSTWTWRWGRPVASVTNTGPDTVIPART